MKITIVNTNAKVALGFPACVTFEVNAKNLAAFNRSQDSLPDANARSWLRGLYSDKFGIGKGNLTMSDVKGAVA